MKCIPSAIAVVLVMFAAPAWAQESAEMRVSGNVTAASGCSISISNGGVVELGEIPYANLNQSSTLNLGVVQRTVSVVCDSPRRFALSVYDNREGTLNPALAACTHCLSMGSTAGHRPIGFYGLDFDYAPLVDGATQTLLTSNDLVSWEMFFGYYLSPVAKVPQSNARRYVAAGAGASTVVAATTASWEFNVAMFLESRDTMAISGPTTIDGSSTLDLIYL